MPTFKTGDSVTVLVPCMGEDHDGVEHRIPAGYRGRIEQIETLQYPAGLAYTVWIPLDESEEFGIVNVFDAGDGPIEHFLALES